MTKSLVIVESPAKAKTIGNYLGSNFEITASVGHIIDLPKKEIGVDIEHGFEPAYEVIPGKEKVLKEIQKKAKKAEQVYLCTDPDREGEAIAWHIANAIQKENVGIPINRATFFEITRDAVLKAIQDAGRLDENKINAQQARRILDRLVGYKISPILWKKLHRGLSAGRVQSVVVKILCDREREILSFEPQEFWTLDARVEASQPPPFLMRLTHKNGKKLQRLAIRNKAEADALVEQCQGEEFVVKSVEKKEVLQRPRPPFITSTLQQEAVSRLRINTKTTMRIAQQLYEGIEVEKGNPVGLITYMRTDSTRIAGKAINEARAYIQQEFGSQYLPKSPNLYAKKSTAQDAHEAIRPTDISLTPERVKHILSSQQLKLYSMIWKRFVACQMAPAVFDQATIIVDVPPSSKENLTFSAIGKVLKFRGHLAVYDDIKQEDEQEEEPIAEEPGKVTLPEVQQGETLKLHKFIPTQNYTKPPSRFSEGSLVRELEHLGIGRPSTYAAIIATIQEKNYVKREQRFLIPTELGFDTTDYLIESFPNILNVKFTAEMEDSLDKIEAGAKNWVDTLKDFYEPFSEQLIKAQKAPMVMEETDIDCEKCGKKMVVRWGKNGKFLACSGYPECKNTQPLPTQWADEESNKIIQTFQTCEKCGSTMIVKKGRNGRFAACPKYPECKNSKPLEIGLACPKCGSPVLERQSRKGKIFYSCSGYPKCDFALWNRPVNQSCPKCKGSYLILRYTKSGTFLICPERGCNFKKQINLEELNLI